MPIPRILRFDTRCLLLSFHPLGESLFKTVFRLYYIRVFLEQYKIQPEWFNIGHMVSLIACTVNEPLIGYLQDFSCKGIGRHRGKVLGKGYHIKCLSEPLNCLISVCSQSGDTWGSGG